MNITPIYVDPVIQYKHEYNLQAWEEAKRLFEQKQYIDSLHAFLKYINTESYKRYMVTPNHWIIPHGSLMVEIKVTDDGFVEVNAPFLKLPPEGSVALLRQIAEFNFNVLKLSQIILEGDSLSFKVKIPLELIDNFKFYGILREICLNGDTYDDIFIEKFGAIPLREKSVRYYEPQVVEKAWTIFHKILDETLLYDEYFCTNRWKDFSFDIMGIGLMKIDYLIAPQGFLRTEIEKTLNVMFDVQKPLDVAINETRENIKKLKSIPKEKFKNDLYEANFFIPARKTADLNQIQEFLSKRYELAIQDKSGGSYTGVVLDYLFATYHLLYNYFISDTLLNEINGVLKACSNISWEQSSEIMWLHFQKIMNLKA